MAYIADHVEARRLIKLKQKNEVALSHAIYNIFNKEPYISNIRRTAGAALQAMLSGSDASVNYAVEEEGRLQVWVNHNAPRSRFGVKMLRDNCGGINGFITRPGSLNAADCGDVFRLVGAWCEHPENWAMRGVKDLERAGLNQKDGPWQQPKGGKRGIRHREHIYDCANIEKRGNRIEIDRTPQDVRRQLLLRGQDKHADQKGVAGRELKRIPRDQSDSVLKIDQLFGLRDVCSISGTTADVMHMINIFGKKAVNGMVDLGEIYRVLPFGTIAGFHHHSILEVALPQSLRGYIDYRIACYSTLVSRSSDDSALSRSIRNALANHEVFVEQNKLHMICFYDEGFPEGAIVLNRNDLNKYRFSPLSQATTLSEKMPTIRNGKLSFKDTLNEIGKIDPEFRYWLMADLPRKDFETYRRVRDTGRVRPKG